MTSLNDWVYSLDAAGNITATDAQDGSRWEYGYDWRYRLTAATRHNTASSPAISAAYRYAYDPADNLLTKQEPFIDDFNDGDSTGCS